MHDFKTEGKVLTVPGWLAVYGKNGHDSMRKHCPP